MPHRLPGSLPETGEFTFELGDDEIEISSALHTVLSATETQ